ncbi:MAG: RNA polymerase subunit sigma [Firmicutes bacterium HGW-Firmicutes-11]|jgi:RNA polymerase sigma factor|nr:MAG: RNA polymerase subunit sigma [Firmicutes bacterium HGW-Firmicutes-11]
MREVDQKAVLAKSDERILEEMIRDCESFILRTAYRATGTYVDKSDDRWSVSLSAFHEAILSYDFDKGSFFPFANTVIRRRLFDHRKQEQRHFGETLLDPEAMSEQEDKAIEIVSDAALEVESIEQILRHYNISFFDLAEASPKAIKTKEACGKAILFLLEQPLLLSELWRTKTLPVKLLTKNLSLTPKILENHRKYIIAAVEILHGEYPILADYFHHLKEGTKK